MLRKENWVHRALSALEASRGPVPAEPNEIDWKSGLSANKERLAEHLSAFANHSNGGYIAFGIDDTTGEPAGIGKENAERCITRLANIGRDAIDPPIRISHAIENVDGKPVLLIYIHESDIKPAHLRGKSIEYAFIRSGGTTRRASRYEIGSMMLNSKNPRWEELRASRLISIDEIRKLLDIEAICTLLGKPLPEGVKEMSDWLASEKMILQDGDLFCITNLGAISAAQDLIEFDKVSRKKIRVIRYRGLNKVDTIDEKEEKRGYAVSFESLIRYIKSILPHSEVIKEALRRETSLYPEIALRELIANALIHQDFSVVGAGPTIEIFENRIEFTNPGTLLPSKRLDRLIGTSPESRNELLASSFRRYGICEERGTGFQKVVANVELYGLPPLKIRELENAFKVTLFSPKKFFEMSRTERIEACYQHAVLKYLSSSALTNTSLRERLKMHEKQRTQVSNIIREAVASGRIRLKDENSSPKFAEYIPYWA